LKTHIEKGFNYPDGNQTEKGKKSRGPKDSFVFCRMQQFSSQSSQPKRGELIGEGGGGARRTTEAGEKGFIASPELGEVRGGAQVSWKSAKS